MGSCVRVVLMLSAALLCAEDVPGASQNADREKALRHYRAGQNALQSEAWERAEREFRAAIQLDPELVPAHYGLGQVHMATKRYADAVRAYLGCRDAFVTEEASRLMDAFEYERRLDDQIRAMEDQMRALQGGRARTGFGSANTTQSTIIKLETQIQSLKSRKSRSDRTREPTPAFISIALGSAYFRNEAFADAEREYKAALAVESKLGEAHNNLAVVYMLTGRLDEANAALKLAEKAGFKVNPKLKEDLEHRLKGR